MWIRGTSVIVITALLIVGQAGLHGSRGAYLRMRLMSTVAPLATVIIVALPHDGFPVWMKGSSPSSVSCWPWLRSW